MLKEMAYRELSLSPDKMIKPGRQCHFYVFFLYRRRRYPLVCLFYFSNQIGNLFFCNLYFNWFIFAGYFYGQILKNQLVQIRV